MPSLWVHLGITAATFAGNSYLKIGGPFQYGTNLLALSSTMLVIVRNKFLVPFMFLPSIFMSKQPQHTQYINNARSVLQSQYPETCSFFKLITKDNVTLDAMSLIHPGHVGVPMEETKWLVWFNPNGASYEEMLDFTTKYARAVGISLLAFNYRGVAKSEGMPEIGEDLVTDGLAAVEHLLKQGVKSENILFHGHSMGGAVATKLRSVFPTGPLINDRSFRSLNHAVTALVVHEPMLGALVGGLIGSVLSSVIGGTITCSYPTAVSSFFLGFAGSGYLGYRWGGIHAPVITLALKALEWDLDVSSVWSKITGHKVVLYHTLDGVIHHDKASMFSAMGILTDHDRATTKSIKLAYEYPERRQIVTTRHQVYHVYSLDTFADDYDLIVKEAKIGLKIE